MVFGGLPSATLLPTALNLFLASLLIYVIQLCLKFQSSSLCFGGAGCGMVVPLLGISPPTLDNNTNPLFYTTPSSLPNFRVIGCGLVDLDGFPRGLDAVVQIFTIFPRHPRANQQLDKFADSPPNINTPFESCDSHEFVTVFIISVASAERAQVVFWSLEIPQCIFALLPRSTHCGNTASRNFR